MRKEFFFYYRVKDQKRNLFSVFYRVVWIEKSSFYLFPFFCLPGKSQKRNLFCFIIVYKEDFLGILNNYSELSTGGYLCPWDYLLGTFLKEMNSMGCRSLDWHSEPSPQEQEKWTSHFRFREMFRVF